MRVRGLRRRNVDVCSFSVNGVARSVASTFTALPVVLRSVICLGTSRPRAPAAAGRWRSVLCGRIDVWPVPKGPCGVSHGHDPGGKRIVGRTVSVACPLASAAGVPRQRGVKQFASRALPPPPPRAGLSAIVPATDDLHLRGGVLRPQSAAGAGFEQVSAVVGHQFQRGWSTAATATSAPAAGLPSGSLP
jgi:hypothetical protein